MIFEHILKSSLGIEKIDVIGRRTRYIFMDTYICIYGKKIVS